MQRGGGKGDKMLPTRCLLRKASKGPRSPPDDSISEAPCVKKQKTNTPPSNHPHVPRTPRPPGDRNPNPPPPFARLPPSVMLFPNEPHSNHFPSAVVRDAGPLLRHYSPPLFLSNFFSFFLVVPKAPFPLPLLPETPFRALNHSCGF